MTSIRVAIVTPFHAEPAHWLSQCHESVRAQSVPCEHIMVGDGARVKPPSTALHIPLPRGVSDYGDTPRSVGSMYAAGLGYDAVLYLDADNWIHPDHVKSILRKHLETGAVIVTTRRSFVDLDGRHMAVCAASDGEQFCDTNCLSVFRPAYDVLSRWALMSHALHAIDDRVVWRYVLDQGFSRAHTGLATAYYRATHAGFYNDIGRPVPPGVKSGSNAIGEAVQAWRRMGFELPVRWGYILRPQPADGQPIAVAPPGPMVE